MVPGIIPIPSQNLEQMHKDGMEAICSTVAQIAGAPNRHRPGGRSENVPHMAPFRNLRPNVICASVICRWISHPIQGDRSD